MPRASVWRSGCLRVVARGAEQRGLGPAFERSGLQARAGEYRRVGTKCPTTQAARYAKRWRASSYVNAARCDRLCQWHNPAVPFSAIRILGIDPGLNRTGYGVVEVNGSRLAFIAAGVIRVPAGDLHQRLGTILRSLGAVIRDTQPQVATIEKVFVNVNPQSTLLLGQARGAAICAAVAEGLVVHEYAALRIKQAVVGFGRADKRQVQTMVQRLLSLDRAPTSDAADALACAICHAHSASLLMALRSKASIAPRVRSTANGRRAWTARLQGVE